MLVVGGRPCRRGRRRSRCPSDLRCAARSSPPAARSLASVGRRPRSRSAGRCRRRARGSARRAAARARRMAPERAVEPGRVEAVGDAPPRSARSPMRCLDQLAEVARRTARPRRAPWRRAAAAGGSRNGSPATSISGLGVSRTRSPRRVPSPPARMHTGGKLGRACRRRRRSRARRPTRSATRRCTWAGCATRRRSARRTRRSHRATAAGCR